MKTVIQGLAGVWVLLFVVSFVALQITPSDGTFAGGLNRIVMFLVWQVIALAVAGVGALTTRHAAERGVTGIKIWGYAPIGMSVFIVLSFIAIMAYRFALVPLLESLGFL